MAVKLTKIKKRTWFRGLLWRYKQDCVIDGRLGSGIIMPIPDRAFVGLSEGCLVVYAATCTGDVVAQDVSRYVSEGANWGADPPSFFWTQLLADLMAEACPEMLGAPQLQSGVKLICAIEHPKGHYFCAPEDSYKVGNYAAAQRELKNREIEEEKALKEKIATSAAAWAHAQESVAKASEAAKGTDPKSPEKQKLKAAKNHLSTLRRTFKKNPQMCPHTRAQEEGGFPDPTWRCTICGR